MISKCIYIYMVYWIYWRKLEYIMSNIYIYIYSLQKLWTLPPPRLQQCSNMLSTLPNCQFADIFALKWKQLLRIGYTSYNCNQNGYQQKTEETQWNVIDWVPFLKALECYPASKKPNNQGDLPWQNKVCLIMIHNYSIEKCWPSQ